MSKDEDMPIAHRVVGYELFREMDDPNLFILILKTFPPGSNEAIEAPFEISIEDMAAIARRFTEEAGKTVVEGQSGTA